MKKMASKISNLLSKGDLSFTVGSTLSFADNDTNKANGTIQRHNVKYAKIYESNKMHFVSIVKISKENLILSFTFTSEN